MRIARRRNHDVEWAGTESQQRQLGELYVERPRLRLRQDRGAVAGLDGAARERLAEGVDPLTLDPVGEHAISRCALPAMIYEKEYFVAGPRSSAAPAPA